MSTTREQLRQFKSSEEARIAGFSTLEWLRAFTFEEHAERIRKEKERPKWWQLPEA